MRVWLFGAGGLVALLFAYAGGRVGTHRWCGGPEGGPVYCAYWNGHHGIYLAAGFAFLALSVLLFALAWRSKRQAGRSASQPPT